MRRMFFYLTAAVIGATAVGVTFWFCTRPPWANYADVSAEIPEVVGKEFICPYPVYIVDDYSEGTVLRLWEFESIEDFRNSPHEFASKTVRGALEAGTRFRVDAMLQVPRTAYALGYRILVMKVMCGPNSGDRYQTEATRFMDVDRDRKWSMKHFMEPVVGPEKSIGP